MTRHFPCLVLVCLAVAACEDANQGPRGGGFSRAPKTQLTASPPENALTSFTVSFAWEGTDPDGVVVYYEWRLVDNGLDGMSSQADRMESAWHATNATDTTLVLAADLPGPPPQKDSAAWRSYTFSVRAVDDRRQRDPTPATVSFTATTLTPVVQFTYEPSNGPEHCATSSTVLNYGWVATDPDDDRPVAATRYALIEIEECLTLEQYEEFDPFGALATDDPRWAPWTPYEVSEPDSRSARFSVLRPDGVYLIAVQARDAAGAVSPAFEWMQNVRQAQVDAQELYSPHLLVFGHPFGEQQFEGLDGFLSRDAFEGEVLDLQWEASAQEYGGRIEAYRWGWNVADLGDPDDPGWEKGWGDTARHRFVSRRLDDGIQALTIEVRDDRGELTRTTYHLSAIPLALEQKPLLFVDDWLFGNTQAEAIINAEWAQAWEDLFQRAGRRTYDVVDAQAEPERVTARLLSEYRNVIWFANWAQDNVLHTSIAPTSFDVTQFNWLEAYQQLRGNLMMVGVGVMFNSLPRINPPVEFPIFFRPGSWAGTGAWPFTGWCLQATDIVRPASPCCPQFPPPSPRSFVCAQLFRAIPAEELLDDRPSATPYVRTLEPNQVRRDMAPEFKFSGEEFYDLDAPAMTAFSPRPCQVPMYRLQARRDGLPIENASEVCRPLGLERSSIDAATIGLISTRYKDTKPRQLGADVLWGFHPLAFEPENVAMSLEWILEHVWHLYE